MVFAYREYGDPQYYGRYYVRCAASDHTATEVARTIRWCDGDATSRAATYSERLRGVNFTPVEGRMFLYRCMARWALGDWIAVGVGIGYCGFVGWLLAALFERY